MNHVLGALLGVCAGWLTGTVVVTGLYIGLLELRAVQANAAGLALVFGTLVSLFMVAGGIAGWRLA